MHLDDLADPTSELSITRQHIYVENGEPEIDTESYNDLSEDQTQHIIDSLQQYTYRRTPGTLFSDGSLSDLGDELLHVFIYKDTTLVNSIMISTTGNISVNNKTYEMKNTTDEALSISSMY